MKSKPLRWSALAAVLIFAGLYLPESVGGAATTLGLLCFVVAVVVGFRRGWRGA